MKKNEIFKIIKLILNSPKNSYYLKKWEDKFADYIGAKHAIAVSSGRSAMQLVLKNLDLKKGDEVIIPAYTLKDLVPIIQSLGLKVIPADIDIDSFDIDPESIKKRISKKTKVILATHIFGFPCKIDIILEIAKKHSLFVIEDCAHSAGSQFNGKNTGSFGFASFFSFEAIKPINTYGGGMIITNDNKLNLRIRQELNDYKTSNFSVLKKALIANIESLLMPTILSYPFLYLLSSPEWEKKVTAFYRLIQGHPNPKLAYCEVQAYLGLEKLKTLDKRISYRDKKAKLFNSLVNKNIRPQKIEVEAFPNYYFFVVKLPYNVVKTKSLLLRNGIDSGIQDEITDDCGKLLRIKCPNSSYVYKHTIHLPIHDGISDEKIKLMAELLNKIYN